MKIDNFALIIGAMKSGTTSLFYALKRHPQITVSSQKEPNFFASNENWAKGLEWYHQLWNWQPSTHKIAVEGSTHYTKIPVFPNAAERIATIDASFKFIYVLRNPLERLVSQCNHALAYDGMKMPITEIPRHFLDLSMYAMQIEEYYKRFPAENILLLSFEEFKQNQVPVLKRVCTFLEIDAEYDFTESEKKLNQYKPQYTNSSTWENLKQIPVLRQTARKFIPSSFRNFVYHTLGRKKQDKFILSTEQRELVMELLREDLRKLYGEYGFDISQWKLDA